MTYSLRVANRYIWFCKHLETYNEKIAIIKNETECKFNFFFIILSMALFVHPNFAYLTTSNVYACHQASDVFVPKKVYICTYVHMCEHIILRVIESEYVYAVMPMS